MAWLASDDPSNHQPALRGSPAHNSRADPKRSVPPPTSVVTTRKSTVLQRTCACCVPISMHLADALHRNHADQWRFRVIQGLWQRWNSLLRVRLLFQCLGRSLRLHIQNGPPGSLLTRSRTTPHPLVPLARPFLLLSGEFMRLLPCVLAPWARHGWGPGQVPLELTALWGWALAGPPAATWLTLDAVGWQLAFCVN